MNMILFLPMIPAGANRVDLWLPVPRTDAWQQVTNLCIESPYPCASSDRDGNAMIHIGIDQPKECTLAVTLSFDAVRKEHMQSRPPALLRCLRSSRAI